jgi:hypothetical protein
MHPAINEHIHVLNGLKHKPSKGETFSREKEGVHEVYALILMVSLGI